MALNGDEPLFGMSFPRRRESSPSKKLFWTPAFAGVTSIVPFILPL